VKHVLFLCFENANRSQIAEAFARIIGNGQVAAFSAGLRPASRLNPLAVSSMREAGHDLGSHFPKGLADVPQVRWDVVVTMGCGETCPIVDSRTVVNWDLPSAKSPGELNRCRGSETPLAALARFCDVLRQGGWNESDIRAVETAVVRLLSAISDSDIPMDVN
jgi:hypothetical protein